MRSECRFPGLRASSANRAKTHNSYSDARNQPEHNQPALLIAILRRLAADIRFRPESVVPISSCECLLLAEAAGGMLRCGPTGNRVARPRERSYATCAGSLFFFGVKSYPHDPDAGACVMKPLSFM